MFTFIINNASTILGSLRYNMHAILTCARAVRCNLVERLYVCTTKRSTDTEALLQRQDSTINDAYYIGGYNFAETLSIATHDIDMHDSQKTTTSIAVLQRAHDSAEYKNSCTNAQKLLDIVYSQRKAIGAALAAPLHTYLCLNETIQLLCIVHNSLFDSNAVNSDTRDILPLCAMHDISPRTQYAQIATLDSAIMVNTMTLKELQMFLAMDASRAIEDVKQREFTRLRDGRIYSTKLYCDLVDTVAVQSVHSLSQLRITQAIYTHCISTALACYRQHVSLINSTVNVLHTNAYQCADMALNMIIYSNDICFEITSRLIKQAQAIAIIYMLNSNMRSDHVAICKLSAQFRTNTWRTQANIEQIIQNVFGQVMSITKQKLLHFNVLVFGHSLEYVIQYIFAQNTQNSAQVSYLIRCLQHELTYVLEHIEHDAHFIATIQSIVGATRQCDKIYARMGSDTLIQCNSHNINAVVDMIDTMSHLTFANIIDYTLHANNTALTRSARILENICIVPCWSHVIYIAIEDIMYDMRDKMNTCLLNTCKQCTIHATKICCATMLSCATYYAYCAFYES